MFGGRKTPEYLPENKESLTDALRRESKIIYSTFDEERSSDNILSYARILRAEVNLQRSRTSITRLFWASRLKKACEDYLEAYSPSEER